MEKRIWEKPEMTEVCFAANEYVAACGDSGISSYMFECNAPRGDLYYYSGNKVSAGATRPESYNGTATKAGSYTPCAEKHNTEDSTDFYWGFVDWNDDGKHTVTNDSDETSIIWLEFNRQGKISDGHATSNLDMTTWETAKS